jgi:hypothetical protein
MTVEDTNYLIPAGWPCLPKEASTNQRDPTRYPASPRNPATILVVGKGDGSEPVGHW